MKKLFTILMLIPILLFGQTNSLVIKNKKSGKESNVNEGEIIRIYINNNSFKGKFKLKYDSSVNTAIVKIEKPNGNYSIPVDQIRSIKLFKTVPKLKKFTGYSMIIIGIATEILSLYQWTNNSRKYGPLSGLEWVIPLVVAFPIVITGLELSKVMSSITFHNKKYDFKPLK